MRLSSSQIEAIKHETEHFFGSAAQVRLFGLRVDDNQRGFTLVEMVMTMVVVGIMAAVAVPRFFDNNTFQSRGFTDQVQASLRYAQKAAIAQHRYVCTAFTTNPNRLTLTIGSANTCGSVLNLPAGSVNYVDAPSGVTFAITPTSFYFDALGRPNTGATATVGTTTITVEAETGYVH